MQLGLASDDRENLQNRAGGEHEVEILVLHDDTAEDELTQVGEGGTPWEGGGVRKHPGSEVEADERGAAKERDREAHAGEGPGAVDEDELADALGGQELEPAREHAAVGACKEVAREADEREFPRVHLEGLGDGGGDGARGPGPGS